MKGHIKLGPTEAELKPYILADPLSRVRSRINPLAPKIQSGANQFNDYTTHEYWEINQWAKGIGYHAYSGVEGGYFYGEVDSRSGDSFILPPLLFAHGEKNLAHATSPILNVDDGHQYVISPPNKIAVKFYMDNPGPVYIYMDSSGVINASIHSDSAGEPGAELWSSNLVNNPSLIVPQWAKLDNDITPTPGTPYWAVLYDDSATLTMHGMVGKTDGGHMLVYDGVAWSDFQTDNGQQLYSPFIAGNGTLGTIIAAQTVADDLYVLNSIGDIYIASGSTFTLFASTGQPSYDMQLWQGNLIVAHGNAAPMTAVAVPAGTSVPLPVNGTILTVWSGYLWRAHNNVAGYSNDASTWTDIPVGPSDYDIVGMAGLDDDVLCSTPQALWRITPGDFVFGVTKWAYQSESNGVNMINNQGVVFIPVENMLIRKQSNAPFHNIWERDESLPGDKAGIISQVIGTNKEVIISIDPADADGVSTTWSFNNQGWHHVAKLPLGQCICFMHYDDSSDSIWLFSDSGHAWRFYASSTASNPLTDYLTTFAPAGFVDMGFFHGGLQTLTKDFDGIQVIGQNISPSKPVRIFWRMENAETEEYIFQNDGSVFTQNDGEPLYELVSGWNFLGDIVESGQTLRWEDYLIRPVGTTIRLAYSIFTNDVSISPKIDGLVVKYHSHIRDQFRWQLPIMVHDQHEDTEEGRDSRSYAEQMAELEALEVDRYLPIWFEDVDGRRFEVKVIGWADRFMRYERKLDGYPILQSVVDFTIEQVAFHA